MERLTRWAEPRGAPVVGTAAVLLGGIAYVVGWGALRHHGVWSTPGDLWDIARSAVALAHGQFAHIYVPHAAVTSPPALEIVLAPFMALGGALGLHPLQTHGTSAQYLWAILGPLAIMIGCSALFALDTTARRWHFSDAQRMALALLGALAVIDVVVVWGHPEDCVAIALMLWSALAMDGDDPPLARAAWLAGLAVAFQPLALLAVVPVFARIPRRALPGLLWRVALPSAVVLIPPLLGEASYTISVLTHQPSYPRIVSSTPFSHLAPTIAPGEVAAGPLRILSTALGAAIAFAVCRRRHDLPTVLLLCAIAFTLRVGLETELTGYYFWPVVALCCVLSMRRSWPRFGLCAAAAVACGVMGNYQVHNDGWWWPAIMLATVAMVACAAVPHPIFVRPPRPAAPLRTSVV